MILLIGAKGSMGRRYQAILRHLGQEFHPVDAGFNEDEVSKLPITRTIIATPTESHAKYIRKYGSLGPVLCEKPITKSISELADLFQYIKDNNINFTMMLQYSKLFSATDQGQSSYNYYNTGGDGLGWDCIQILGLAKGSVVIKNDSPYGS